MSVTPHKLLYNKFQTDQLTEKAHRLNILSRNRGRQDKWYPGTRGRLILYVFLDLVSSFLVSGKVRLVMRVIRRFRSLATLFASMQV